MSYICFGISRNDTPMDEKVNPINERQDKIARYGKALSSPVRVFILEYLANHANRCCYSGDMAEVLPIARSTLSEHLKELKNVGLIKGEINPPYIKYCIDSKNWQEARSVLAGFFEQ